MGSEKVIVLDTHAWIWAAVESRKLSAKARKIIAAEEEILVSAISCWEVAMLVEKRRIQFRQDVLQWIREALELPKLALAPLLPQIAVGATRLGRTFHEDPADRIIVATALHHGARLVTADKLIRGFEGVETIW